MPGREFFDSFVGKRCGDVQVCKHSQSERTEITFHYNADTSKSFTVHNRTDLRDLQYLVNLLLETTDDP